MKTKKFVWGNPIMNVQLFVPQDCIAACKPITDRYIDLDKDGRYDTGEELEGGGYLINVGEATYYDINAYNNRNGYSYSGTLRYYHVVDVRYEGWFLFSFYKPYNATS